MRASVRGVLAVAVASVTVYWGSTAVDTAGLSLPMSSAIESVTPARGDVVGIAQPVVITFKEPVADQAVTERALSVRTGTETAGKFEWLNNKVVQWVPDEFWPAHSTVSLTVAGAQTEFKTGPAVVGVASISQHTFTVTIDGQSPIDLPSPHHLPHAGEPGVLLASLGSPEYATPVGTYPVLAKDRHVTMDSSSVGIPIDDPDGYLTDVEFAVRISARGLYVHSAPWAVESMGFENVSHGCISLAPAAAEWYFNTVKVGDPVIVEE